MTDAVPGQVIIGDGTQLSQIPIDTSKKVVLPHVGNVTVSGYRVTLDSMSVNDAVVNGTEGQTVAIDTAYIPSFFPSFS